jgi:hypothetical protein
MIILIADGLSTEISIMPESIEAFKQLISKGINTWDSAPPEIKQFAAELLEGKRSENYYLNKQS